MDTLLPFLYIIGLYSAYVAGSILLRTMPAPDANQRSPFHFPRTTLLLFLLVAVPSTLQFVFPQMLTLWQRDAARILQGGEWWRLVTALLVQDGEVRGTVFNLVSLLLLGAVVEQLWSSRETVLFFFTGGICGELVALAWQPTGAGNSVGNFGLAAALAVACLLRPATWVVRGAAALALVADGVLLVLRDIHGAAALAGALLALWLAQLRRR